MHAARTAVGLSLLLAVAGRGATDRSVDSLACQERFAAHPESEDGPRCFWETVKNEHGEAAADALTKLAARYPRLPWPSFYLGNLQWNKPERAQAAYRQAAARFAVRGEHAGEAKARLNLDERLVAAGRDDEAGFELQRAERAARASRDSALLAEVWAVEAKQISHSLGDLAKAGQLLDQAEPLVSAPGRDRAKGEWLKVAGDVSLETGRLEQAQSRFRELAALAARRADDALAAAAQYGLLRVVLERAGEEPGHFRPEDIQGVAQSSVAAASKDGDPGRYPHWVLGMLTGGKESADHFARCAAGASPGELCFCQSGLARHLAESEPARAEAAIERAKVAMEQGADPADGLRYWGARMRVSAFSHPADLWRDGQAALAAIEALRRAQGPKSRAGRFSTWSADYYFLAGRLLDSPGSGPTATGEAFAVAEHLRGRMLFEALNGAGAEPPSPRQLKSRRTSILRAIASVRERAADRALPASEREIARADLKELGHERAEVERRLRQPASTPLAEPFAGLPEVSDALAPDEALLSYQVAPWKDWTGAFGGGSWLTVATHGAPPRVYRLPSAREDLRDRVSQLITPLDAPLDAHPPDAGEETAIAHLYGTLLASPLRALSGVRHLIIVPDDDLHKLPWAALRATAGERRLAERYEISIAPSATLWLRWRRERPPPVSVPALVLATSGAGLSLPRARDEGEAVRASLPRSELVSGLQASEARVKRADLARYGILHLAAHSVVDLENPERSAVRLSPGGREDGELRFGEILQLKLGGRLVVLSSCETAGGRILRGEGPLSLARAFFHARAHAVVASLWPLEDADAQAFFAPFYRHLAAGEPVAAALRAAQRERIAAGAPLAAWAGLEVLGDGDLMPLGSVGTMGGAMGGTMGGTKGTRGLRRPPG